MHRIVFAGLAVVASVTVASQAAATPQPLPFTYTTETLDDGDMEVEQYIDMTPVRELSTQLGTPTWYLASQFQTEFEYGLGHRLELGLYVTYAPSEPGVVSSAVLTEGTGFKERLRYTLADPGEWPIDVGVYGELVENNLEFELEGKILLQRRFGNLRLDANLWAEYELYYDPSGQRDVVLNPTAGATYEVTPSLSVGLEGWMRAEFSNKAPPGPRPFALGPHEFVGPAVMLNFGKLWWSTGVYLRVDEMSHVAAAGDNYGPMWARTIIGYEL